MPRPFAILAAIASVAVAHAASAAVVSSVASNNSTIRPAGPRTGTSNLAFLNVEGDTNGANASYGVVDFTGSGFGAAGTTNVTGFSLSIGESNAAFSVAGSVEIYLATSSAASINNDGTSTLVYTAGSTPMGLASTAPFGTLIDLGTLVYGTTGNVNSGQIDTFSTSSLPASAQSLLSARLNDGGIIRLVVTPNTAATAATYAGSTNNTAGSRPTLTLTTAAAVPEPTSLAAMGLLGGAALVRRRRAVGI